MGFLTNKRCLIVGLASKRSIAWGIAQAMAQEGASTALTYQNDKLGERVKQMADALGSDICLPLDVAEDREIDGMFALLKKRWDMVDVIVHSVAFAPRDQLAVTYLESVYRIGFAVAHDISARIAYIKERLAKAATAVVHTVLKEAGGSGGIIGIDAQGNVVMEFNTNAMTRGSIDTTGNLKTAIFK